MGNPLALSYLAGTPGNGRADDPKEWNRSGFGGRPMAERLRWLDAAVF
jgi:hypothetical protein